MQKEMASGSGLPSILINLKNRKSLNIYEIFYPEKWSTNLIELE
jgi:hypothetical protein